MRHRSPSKTPSDASSVDVTSTMLDAGSPENAPEAPGTVGNPIAVDDSETETEGADGERRQGRRQRRRKRKAFVDESPEGAKKVRTMRDAFRRLSVTPEPDSERPTLHGDTDRPIGHRTTTRRPQLAPMVHRGALVVALPIDPPSADASRPFTRHPAMGPLANDGPSRFPVTLGQAPTDRVLPEHRPVFDELLVALLEDPQRARRVLRHGSVGLIWDRVQLSDPFYTWQVLWYLYKADFRRLFAEVMGQ